MNYLLPHERNVIIVRRHPGVFISHISLLACCCTAASLLTAMTNSGPLALGAAWAACLVVFLWLIMRVIAWVDTYIVATEIRLVIITGLVTRRATTVPVREIDTALLRRSVIGLIAGYGEIITYPVRQEYIIPRLKYMPYPQQLLQEINGLLHPGFNNNAAG
ncbi:MAG TPA: hypothetical protein VIY52_03010 [Streptosporangiaceae bacterium]